MHKNNRTRCPECWELLQFSDMEDPDVVISHHMKKCGKEKKAP